MRRLRPLLTSAAVISLLTVTAAIPANAAGADAAVAAAAPAAGQYQPLVTARIATTTIPAADDYSFSPLGRAGIPAGGVSAIAFQLHALSDRNGLLQVHPSDATRGNTSTVNFAANQPADNAVISGLGADGKLTIRNGSTVVGSSVRVDVDVVGYYTSDTATTARSTFVPLHPARLVPAGTPLRAGTAAPIAPLGAGGIPSSGVTAVVAAVSVQPGSTTAGQLVAYPSGVTKPGLVYDLRYPGTTGARYTTQITVPLGADGRFVLESTTAATAWVEVAGYFQNSSGTATGSVFRPVTPARVGGEHIIEADEDPTAVVPFAGRAGVPATGASAVVFNLTANSVAEEGAFKAGAVNTYATGAQPPVARQLSYQADNRRWPTQQVSRLGSDGQVVLRNTGGGTVRLLADVLGYYVPVTTRLSGLPWNSGAGVQPMDRGFIDVFGDERGAPVDNVVLFPPRESWNWMLDYKLWERSLPKNFDPVRQDLVQTVPLWTKDRTLATFGTQDEWETLAKETAKIDPDAYVRLAWEMNLPSSYWALTQQNRVAWQAAYIQAVTWMTDVAPGLRIVWNPNKGDDYQTCPTNGDCAREVFQAVKDHVDVYAIDSYDSYPAADTPEGRDAHLNADGYLRESLAYAVANGKKFAVPEWGISCNVSLYPEPDRDCDWAGHAGGDNPAYIKLYQDFFAANAADLAFESYFDEPALYIQSSLIQSPLGPDAPAAYRAGIAAHR